MRCLFLYSQVEVAIRLCQRIRTGVEETRELDPTLSLGRVACGYQVSVRQWVKMMRYGTERQEKRHFSLYDTMRVTLLNAALETIYKDNSSDSIRCKACHCSITSLGDYAHVFFSTVNKKKKSYNLSLRLALMIVFVKCSGRVLRPGSFLIASTMTLSALHLSRKLHARL